MPSQKIAIITGITGQDGAHLADFLLNKQNYIVYGTHRHTTFNFWRLEDLGIRNHPNLHLIEYDFSDPDSSIRLIEKVQPDEVYNLASISFVGVSFEQPVATSVITGLGPLYLLEAIRIVDPKIRFYQASTSEMFGKAQEIPQTETTPFYPRSPYGVAKQFAHWMTINYAESYDIFACSGILFNHESPLRDEKFVTRKITKGLASIKLGQQSVLEVGNLSAQRDWGHAKDYVIGMWKMLQQEQPSSYILATGRTVTVREFLKMAGTAAGFDLQFEGEGANEIAIDKNTKKQIVKINPEFYRPADVDFLIGNPTKAKQNLNWEARITIEELAWEMVTVDLQRLARKL